MAILMQSTVMWNVALNELGTKVLPYDSSLLFRVLRKMGWNMAATTTWWCVYMKPEYIGTDRGAEILYHEKVHVDDMKRHPILFGLSYFLLPVGPSFKAYWEWRAYKVDIKRVYDQYKDFADKDYLNYIVNWQAEWVAQQFWSPGYAWMWPFPGHVRRFIKKYVDKLKG